MDSHRGELNETAAVRAYSSYKLDYRKRALADYFEQHKEEEWFLEKYHPILVDRREIARIEKVFRRMRRSCRQVTWSGFARRLWDSD